MGIETHISQDVGGHIPSCAIYVVLLGSEAFKDSSQHICMCTQSYNIYLCWCRSSLASYCIHMQYVHIKAINMQSISNQNRLEPTWFKIATVYICIHIYIYICCTSIYLYISLSLSLSLSLFLMQEKVWHNYSMVASIDLCVFVVDGNIFIHTS